MKKAVRIAIGGRLMQREIESIGISDDHRAVRILSDLWVITGCTRFPCEISFMRGAGTSV